MAKLLNVHRNIVSNKLNGESKFTFEQASEIYDVFFPEYKDAPTVQKTANAIHPQIKEYMLLVESGKLPACKEQHQLIRLVRKVFREENVYTDSQLLEKCLSLQKYYHFNLFPWEKFLLGLHLCTFQEDRMPRWADLFTLVRRGAGKDEYIGYQSFCLVSPYNPISHYNVDICANSELQAKTPFEDVHSVMESPQHFKKLQRFFYWNMEEIVGLKNKGVIKYRTNNPKGKDGFRSAEVVFNEVNQHEDYAEHQCVHDGPGQEAASEAIIRHHGRRCAGRPAGSLQGTQQAGTGGSDTG